MNGRAVSYTAREAKSLCPLTCPAALRTRSPFPSSGRRASPPPPLLLQELSPTQGLGDPVRGGIRTGPSPEFPHAQAQSPGSHPAEPKPLDLLLSPCVASVTWALPALLTVRLLLLCLDWPSPRTLHGSFLVSKSPARPTDQKELSQRRQALLHFSVMISSIQMIFTWNSS